MTIEAAADSEDERELLVALRTAIAQALDEGVLARDLASLTRRVMEINREIAAIDAMASKGGDGVVDTPAEQWDGDY